MKRRAISASKASFFLNHFFGPASRQKATISAGLMSAVIGAAVCRLWPGSVLKIRDCGRTQTAPLSALRERLGDNRSECFQEQQRERAQGSVFHSDNRDRS